jgi:hypothetical protein
VDTEGLARESSISIEYQSPACGDGGGRGEGVDVEHRVVLLDA